MIIIGIDEEIANRILKHSLEGEDIDHTISRILTYAEEKGF
jgi:hypothetical protein